MFYLTSKFHDNRVNTFGFMGGGGEAFEAIRQAQELQKTPGGIGCISHKYYFKDFNFKAVLVRHKQNDFVYF